MSDIDMNLTINKFFFVSSEEREGGNKTQLPKNTTKKETTLKVNENRLKESLIHLYLSTQHDGQREKGEADPTIDGDGHGLSITRKNTMEIYNGAT